MSSAIELPPYLRYDKTLRVFVPRNFSREEAIGTLDCQPCFLDKFPEMELRPGTRKIHLVNPESGIKSLGEILKMLGSERTLRLESLETALLLADQHPGYRIEVGLAFLAYLWNEGKKMSTSFFPYLSSGLNGRHAIHIRSDQRKLHPGWRIAVSSLPSDPRMKGMPRVEAEAGWTQPWLQPI